MCLVCPPHTSPVQHVFCVQTIKTCLLRVLAVLPYHSWSPPAYTRELEERISRCSLWPSQEAIQSHYRELDRTPHLYLVWKVGCKEVVDCIKSGAGRGKQSRASLHRHPLGLQLFLPSAALPGFLPHTGWATQCWSPWTTGGTKQQLTSLQKWLCAMTEKPVSRGSRNSKNGMKLEQINKLDGNLIGRLKSIAVGSDLSCD